MPDPYDLGLDRERAGESLNTTIAVVATNAPLEKAAALWMSGNAHDGMARAVQPIHTLADGGTVFAVSTGGGTSQRVNDPADSQRLNVIFKAGATTLPRAIANAARPRTVSRPSGAG